MSSVLPLHSKGVISIDDFVEVKNSVKYIWVGYVYAEILFAYIVFVFQLVTFFNLIFIDFEHHPQRANWDYIDVVKVNVKLARCIILNCFLFYRAISFVQINILVTKNYLFKRWSCVD